MAERIPSIFGEPVWTEHDAVRTREFFASATGVRFARIIALNVPTTATNPERSAERALGAIEGYQTCMALVDGLRVIPGTVGNDGELVPGAPKTSPLPDLDLPPGDPAWGGTSDPATRYRDELEVAALPVGT